MAHHIVEFDQKCKACKGSGLYVGMAERDGAAVICSTCKGTGKVHTIIKYDDFEGRETPSERIERVFKTNPGIIIGTGKGLKLSDFGGMPFSDWADGKPFPTHSENRKFTCPAWWYESADYSKKPNWDECQWGGTFSSCQCFPTKGQCWQRWDDENK